MNINSYTNKIIKIISQHITYDWRMPFKIDSTRLSVGTGFFINTDGYLLTCFHVIEHSKKIYAEVPSEGKYKYELEVISVCPMMDIALLKIKKFKVKEYCKLDTTNKVAKGNEVFALGFPLGLDNLKLTKGIISGRDKHLYQTDTPINPGNSGGPLICNNKVIGINSSGYNSAQNVGFAIPITQYTLIQKDMLKHKIIVLPLFLGLSYNNIHDNSIKVLCNKCQTGIYIKKVYKQAPISKSGIKNGDILMAINKHKIDHYGLLDTKWLDEKLNINNILLKYKLNAKITITYSHDNKIIKSTFINTGFNLPIRQKYPMYENIGYELFCSICVMNLAMNHNNIVNTNNLGEYVKYKNRTKPKLIITSIFENSYLDNLNVFNEGDIIAKVNGKRVSTISAYKRALAIPIIKNKLQYIELISDENKYMLIPIKKALEEHLAFANIYKYPISNIYKKLSKINKVKN
jgi:S1-C subfamily serine protease